MSFSRSAVSGKAPCITFRDIKQGLENQMVSLVPAFSFPSFRLPAGIPLVNKKSPST